jgi:hypothetical protein
VILALLSACHAPEQVHGTLRNALTLNAIPGASVRAVGESEDCLRVSAPSDAQGRFDLADLCPGEDYRLEPVGETWFLVEPTPARAEVELQLWPLPESDGVYRLDEATYTPLLTNTQLEPVHFNAGGEARYPLSVPEGAPRVTGNQFLALIGAEAADGWTLQALVANPNVHVQATGRAEVLSLSPWYLVGVDTSAGDPKPVAPPSLPGGRRLGDRSVRFIQANLVPAGLYVLCSDSAARGLIVGFGEAPSVTP